MGRNRGGSQEVTNRFRQPSVTGPDHEMCSVQNVYYGIIWLWKLLPSKSKRLSVCEFVTTRGAGQLSSYATPVTEDSGIAPRRAEQQSGGNNCAQPVDGISEANQVGSLIVIGSGVTESAKPGRV